MRKYKKRDCLEIIKTLDSVHAEVAKCAERMDAEGAAMLLEQCQQAAIAIGTIIEESEGEGTEAVGKLEEYCELLYQVNLDIQNGVSANVRQMEKKLRKQIYSAQSAINALPVRYEAVFLPYKAAMWDSLESIYLAFNADPDFDACVVPIPYYDKRPDGSFAKINYDIDLFPEEIPVMRYTDYDIKERQPDVVFIHNPYDDCNFVTSVHPDYYTVKLRQYTDCLVYVPYYATAGNMSEAQSILPSYFRCDYIVVQSERMAEFFDKRVPRDKFIPVGSPKFDKVIRLCANPPEPPEEWKEKLEGKTVFFYNTSIDGFLKDTPALLKKLSYVFETFKGKENACLLWRPHPLLESTMDSMRPEFKEEYHKLKEYFVKENIGILDETADIEKTIALCDAYVGDAGTSVTSLFGVVGKPMYILNNMIHEAPGEGDWLSAVTPPVRGDRNNRYVITMGNRLFVDKDGDKNYRYLCDLSDEYTGGGYYSQAIEAGGKIVVFPNNAEHILLIDPETLEKEKIDLKHRLERDGAFFWAFNFIATDNEDTFYILPNRYPELVSFNVKTGEVRYISDEAFDDEFSIFETSMQERVPGPIIAYLDEGPCFSSEETTDLLSRIQGTEKKYTVPDGSEQEYFMVKYPEIPGITLKGPKLLCIDVTGKRLRAVQLETGKVEERAFGLDGMYTAALRDIHNLDVFWFLPYSGTTLCKWIVSEDNFEFVDVSVEGLKSYRRPQRYETGERYFSNGVFYKDKLILSPQWGNKFVEVDVNTHEAKEWIPPFPFTTEDKNDYWKNWGMGSFLIDAFDWSYGYYYAPEHILYSVDLEKHSAVPVSTGFDKEDVFSLAAGFHKESQWMPYCCFEDVFNSISDMAEGNIHGPSFDKDRQIEAYRTVNASPDGDCGEKVYRFLKGKVL